MDIVELGAVGELVGGVAVIGTLVYLGLQVKQSTRTSRSAGYQAAVSSVSDWSRNVGSDAELAVIMHDGSRDPSSLSREQRIQYVYLITSVVRNFENIHYQYENGSLDDSVWDSWEARIRGFFTAPGPQAFWKRQRMAYSASFRDFVEAEAGPVVSLPEDPLAGDEV